MGLYLARNSGRRPRPIHLSALAGWLRLSRGGVPRPHHIPQAAAPRGGRRVQGKLASLPEGSSATRGGGGGRGGARTPRHMPRRKRYTAAGGQTAAGPSLPIPLLSQHATRAAQGRQRDGRQAAAHMRAARRNSRQHTAGSR